MVTITVSGFKTKNQAIEWLVQYEGAVEQFFDFDDPNIPCICVMEEYIPEMKEFKENKDKRNFNLKLKAEGNC